MRILVLLLFCMQQLTLAACEKDEYYLVILVTARHLNYQNAPALFRTIAKHPSDWSKNGDVGHAWIYLKGEHQGESVYFEGGHSGELGVDRPKYFEGVMNYNAFGRLQPTEWERQNPCYEPNPIKYLWESTQDGFFQQGCGGHVPTYAIKVDIAPQVFWDIARFIDPSHYPYVDYALTQRQCTSFATQVAALAGLKLQDKVSISICPSMTLQGVTIRLWTDPVYSTITLATPDALENSMRAAVREGKAVDVTAWYKKKYPKTCRQVCQEWKMSFCLLPERWQRALLFRRCR